MADDTYAEFRDAVNMSASELEKWLATEDSKEVGQKSSSGAESVGHDSGRKIIKILNTKKADLTEADEAHMRKVVGYVHRHMAQRPNGDVEHTKWRYSLMNWGHDPLKQ
jgi:DNA topoisomerase VI subunit B